MLSSRKKKSRFLLRTLGRKVSLKGLPHVQPLFLLQILIGVSQALNGSAAHAEALARALVLDGRRRLSGLRHAAPHLNLSLDQLLRMARSDERSNDDLSAEESATRALLEVCLGLMLRWLSKRNRPSHPSMSCGPSRCSFSVDIPFPLTFFSLILPLRARACPTSQP
jgi:hypothetical protein